MILCLPTYNRNFRTTPRTAGCTKYENETKKSPASAISSHIRWSARPSQIASHGPYMSTKGSRGDHLVPPWHWARNVVYAGFWSAGSRQPEKKVTRKGFFVNSWLRGLWRMTCHTRWVRRGVWVSYSSMCYPRGFAIPSHQTVRRDLDILYEKLNTKVNTQLKVSTFTTSSMTLVKFYLCSKIVQFIEDCDCERSLDKQKFCLCFCRCCRVLDWRWVELKLRALLSCCL